MSVHLNVRTTPTLVHEVDSFVEKGIFRNRTEAVNEAIRLLIRSYHMAAMEKRIDLIGENTKDLPSVTEAVIKSHEEEDSIKKHNLKIQELK